MTLPDFLWLLFALSTLTSLITEAIKKLNASSISSNLIALAISVIVGVGGTTVYYLFENIAYNPTNIACIAIMTLMVWLCAMLGYDKVKQAIDQVIKSKEE